MASISSLGIGSGMDLNGLLDQLKAAERQKLVPIVQQQKSYEAKISAFGKLESALDKFQDAAAKLNKPDTFRAVTSNVTGEGFTAASSSKAVPGRYEVAVTSLARAQSLASPGVVDKSAQQGTGAGTISITQNGTTTDIAIADGASSLTDIRNAINATDGLGVTASIVNDGDPTAPYRLVLTSDETGTQSEMTLATSGNTRLADLLTYDGTAVTSTMTETVDSQNASLTVNGISISSQSNRLEEAIQGVTLDLTTENSSGILTVSGDSEGITQNVRDFVDAYNSLQKTIDGLTGYNKETDVAGQLLGDSTMRSVESRLRNVMGSSAGAGTAQMLSDVGIELTLDGSLKINDEKLGEWVNNDPEGLNKYFAGTATTDGLADKVGDTLGTMLDFEGMLDNATNGLQKRVGSLQDRFDRMESTIDSTVERYRQQFAQMDTLVAQMNSTMSYLGQQFNAMNAQLGRK
nr:flagellar filament capping protein FliD [uncultured Halomonas sp.]